MAVVSNSNRDELRRLLKVIQDNTTAGDWSNNLFVGVVYFLMGDNDEGITCVEENIDFGYEDTVSQAILAEMKKGKLDAFTLYALKDDLKELIDKPQKQTSGKRRDLTEDEIIAITRKYGFIRTDEIAVFVADALSIPRSTKILTRRTWGGFTMSFAHDRIYWTNSSLSGGSMSYDDLRNNPEVTYNYLQNLFKDFPSEVAPTLRELKGLE